ncbi:MAG: 4Fe-4S binding protein [Dehalococcoidales bacterium]|nr:4Fe-4S binding protein [Dehalococcoidales bacterium]
MSTWSWYSRKKSRSRGGISLFRDDLCDYCGLCFERCPMLNK